MYFIVMSAANSEFSNCNKFKVQLTFAGKKQVGL